VLHTSQLINRWSINYSCNGNEGLYQLTAETVVLKRDRETVHYVPIRRLKLKPIKLVVGPKHLLKRVWHDVLVVFLGVNFWALRRRVRILRLMSGKSLSKTWLGQ